MSAEVDIAVIGAGVVGLACAAHLARDGRSVLVLERNDGPGRETTSRNSGVIHAGLYYAAGSLKAESCVEGRRLLYARCERLAIPHRRTEKLIVATDADEEERLHGLLERGRANGVEGLSLIGARELGAREPYVRGVAALRSETSGIVDAHALTESYAAEAEEHGATIAYRVEVRGAAFDGRAFVLDTVDADGAPFTLRAARVVNAAGLFADRIAETLGVDVDEKRWRLRWCKGDYMTLSSRLRARFRHLVYPMPVHAGLGVHLTLDLGGGVRAGPDTTYVDTLDYDVDPAKVPAFAAAVRRYVPDLEDADLTVDYAGIRPKLYGPDEPVRDFVVEADERGAVHLVGIESPGITASEALARRVAALLA
ncbi:MAG: NAD(P)/FAD-dependent oxidoreductase [Sandaracinaceae bacterium]